MKLFRLLQGLHVQRKHGWVASEEEIALAKEQGTTPQCPEEHFKAGDTVASNKDLVAKFGSEKFQYVGEEGTVSTLHASAPSTPGTPANAPTTAGAVNKPPCPSDHDLNKMSLEDLKALAEDEEIDLKGSTRKEDIVRRIKAGW